MTEQVGVGSENGAEHFGWFCYFRCRELHHLRGLIDTAGRSGGTVGTQ